MSRSAGVVGKVWDGKIAIAAVTFIDIPVRESAPVKHDG